MQLYVYILLVFGDEHSSNCLFQVSLQQCVFFGNYVSILKMTVSTLRFIIGKLGGGFKDVFFSPLLEEMIHFD